MGSSESSGGGDTRYKDLNIDENDHSILQEYLRETNQIETNESPKDKDDKDSNNDKS